MHCTVLPYHGLSSSPLSLPFDLFLPPTSLLYFLHSLSTPHPWLLPGNQPTALITLSLLHLSSAHTNGFCRHASLMLLWRNMWGKKKVLCWISKLNTTYCKTITTTFFYLSVHKVPVKDQRNDKLTLNTSTRHIKKTHVSNDRHKLQWSFITRDILSPSSVTVSCVKKQRIDHIYFA